jgi:hypothetical protein
LSQRPGTASVHPSESCSLDPRSCPARTRKLCLGMLPLPVSGLVAVAVLQQAVLVRAGASWDMVHVGVAASGQRACPISGKGGVARPVRADLRSWRSVLARYLLRRVEWLSVPSPPRMSDDCVCRECRRPMPGPSAGGPRVRRPDPPSHLLSSCRGLWIRSAPQLSHHQ